MQLFGKKGVQWLTFSNKRQFFAFSLQPAPWLYVSAPYPATSSINRAGRVTPFFFSKQSFLSTAGQAHSTAGDSPQAVAATHTHAQAATHTTRGRTEHCTDMRSLASQQRCRCDLSTEMPLPPTHTHTARAHTCLAATLRIRQGVAGLVGHTDAPTGRRTDAQGARPHIQAHRHAHAVTRPGQRSSEHRLTITTPTDLTAGPCRSQQRVALNPRGLPLAVRSAWHRASAAAASKRRRLVGASHTHQRRRIVQMRTSAAARSQRHAHDDDEKTRRCGHDAARRVRHAATARPR